MSTRLIHRSDRLVEIERLLRHSANGLRAVEIAAACGVDRRTVYRDLALMVKQGAPVYQKAGRFLLNQEYYMGTLRLNANEAVALFIAARTLENTADQQNPHLVSALKKLSTIMPDPIALHVNFTIESAHGDPVDRAFVNTIEILIRAWAERRKLKIWYRTPGSKSTLASEFAVYFVEPTASGGLYTVGFDYLVQRVRAFKLQWLKRIELLQGRYETPAYLDRRRYLAGLWGTVNGEAVEQPVDVVLVFSGDLAPRIKERTGHTAQRVTVLSDERCALSFQVADWREVLPWVRSFGAQVEVLEPKAMREFIAAEAEKISQSYEAKV